MLPDDETDGKGETSVSLKLRRLGTAFMIAASFGLYLPVSGHDHENRTVWKGSGLTLAELAIYEGEKFLCHASCESGPAVQHRQGHPLTVLDDFRPSIDDEHLPSWETAIY
jgi:hypothetical protein